MQSKIDNKGAVDFANNWTISRCIRHVDVRLHFLRELKELGIIETEWIANAKMASDVFTKSVSGPDFKKHVPAHVSDD